MGKNKKVYYPLTISQKVLLAPQIVTYNPRGSREYNVISVCVDLHKGYDFSALEKACNEVVKRNDALRLNFRVSFKGIEQSIAPFSPINIEHLTFDSEEQFQEFLENRQDYLRIKLLGKDVVRFAVADYDTGSKLIIRVNHFACDGYSVSLIAKRLMKYYEAFVSGKEPESDEKLYSIETFLQNEKKLRRSETQSENFKFWKKRYSSQPHFADPFRGRKYRSKVAYRDFEISGQDYQEVLNYCKEINVPIMVYLQIAAAATINRITGLDNFLFWVLNHGRSTIPLKNTVGCMMNAIPLLFDFSKDETIDSMIKGLFIQQLENMRHGHLGLLLHFLGGWKTFLCKGGPNVFCFLWSALDLTGLEDERMKFDVLPHHYLVHPMYCCAYETKGVSAKIRLIYQEDLYTDDEINLMENAYFDVVKFMKDNPEAPVSHIPSSWKGTKLKRFLNKKNK